jgi:hypothetical protein
MGNWMQFEKCGGCGWDIGTGEGERNCSWGECAYLPTELDVYCEQCRFNYFSLEGNPSCDDPLTCEHARSLSCRITVVGDRSRIPAGAG